MSGAPTRKPRRDDLLELSLEELGPRGEAVGRLGELRVRVRDGVPGASVRARVLRRRRDVVDARVEEVLDPGPAAVEPRCAHFGTCGGCARQDLAYPEQLRLLGRALGRLVAPLLEPDTRVAPVVGMDEPWRYRNKMDFTFASRRWVEPDEPEEAERDFALGLHVPGRFDKVLDVRECAIAFPEAEAIVATARREARARGLAPWDVRTHTGLLRHLVLRKGVRTGELLAFLVTSPGADSLVDGYAAALLAAHPELSTLVHGTNAGLATVATAGEQRVLHGPGTIREELCGLSFTVSAESFFQTNTLQAERLARTVREEAGLREGEVLYDLYCGGGALSLVLASSPPAPRAVVGFELVPSAVEDARRNARANGVANARFVPGDLAGTLGAGERAALELPAPDVCVVDPPRAGVHPRVLEALGALAPRRIVYVSCNPRSAVRDVLPWRERYALAAVRPLDLFPHTPHLECVFTLERRA